MAKTIVFSGIFCSSISSLNSARTMHVSTPSQRKLVYSMLPVNQHYSKQTKNKKGKKVVKPAQYGARMVPVIDFNSNISISLESEILFNSMNNTTIEEQKQNIEVEKYNNEEIKDEEEKELQKTVDENSALIPTCVSNSDEKNQ